MTDHDDQHIARTLAEAALLLEPCTAFDPCRYLTDAWDAAEVICRERGWPAFCLQWSVDTESHLGSVMRGLPPALSYEDDTPARALSLALMAALDEEEERDDA